MIHPHGDAPASASTVPVGSGAPPLELVCRARAGDASAQTELVARYSRRLAGYLRSLCRREEAVEDLTQLTFIKMFRRLRWLRDPAVFEPWLFRIARNTAYDAGRRRACRPATVALDAEALRIPDPGHEEATREILGALETALAQLKPIDRQLVRLIVTGESYAEAARRFGLTVASVKVRLHRVRPFLRSTVGELTATRSSDTAGWRSSSRPVRWAA
ncbi:MAG: RNA polymerase sigma factor [Opitutaceae bacterium]